MSMMLPASTGPASEAREPMTPSQPMARPRRCGGYSMSARATEVEIIMAPAQPCRTRAPISQAGVSAVALRTAITAKPAMPLM